MYYNKLQVSRRTVILVRADCPCVFGYIIETVLKVHVFWDVKFCRWGDDSRLRKDINAFIFRASLPNGTV